ncbi:MAG: isoleucine--tRNA ligase [Candidatus Saganbacteria bacterium]|nr:isoleucine--tRNA ligase [Candidatus Saganbacteria bacterium]
MEYKNTLNLPSTDFPIKANFKEKEPEFLKYWESSGLYQKMQEGRSANKYILHDGPPYPNGDIHLGHALNKILKDIVVKFRAMEGYSVPFVPGWDCHGLPIETQLIKELSVRRSSLSVPEFRQKCRQYALKYVDIQKEQFKRLGIIAKWDGPYLTLDKDYEAGVIELFGKLADGGYVYKSLKPIHWCPNCETALAEAEIEYEDDPSPSIFVRFKVKNTKSKNKVVEEVLSTGPSNFIIWTTTPWTLPSNVAIAVHPGYDYDIVRHGNEMYVIAHDLLDRAAQLMKWPQEDYSIVSGFKGRDLEGIVCSHPFIDRESVVVLDEFVTLESGTGCVHIAPGHGEEDYKVGLIYKLPIIMPVDGKGLFTDDVPKYSGVHVWKANPLILEEMKENGSLLASDTVKHQYPHCWRCKKPIIFRATEQWFISVDHNNLRQTALDEISHTKWFPSWGENRINGMVKTRPDWCISRQRSWGIPIPAFYCLTCGKPNFKGAFNKAAVETVKKEGTDAWFIKEAKDILPAKIKCEFCGGSEFRKETDIMDVWLESGSSHYSVLKSDPKVFSWPADLYLEGSDQHRGWFQTSLLTAVAVFKKAPFKAVLTHGFTVDEKGKKMSKSLGNIVDPQTVVREYGADVLRLWVASTDFRNDMAVSRNILKQINEGFSKIRNTCRFLLSNINDFDPEKDRVEHQKLKEIDKYILFKLEGLIQKIHKSYDEFEFHTVYHCLYGFCVNDLSAFYLNIIKDRLYCDSKGSVSRRAAQTTVHELLTAIIRIMAPVLSFTAEELFRRIRDKGPNRGEDKESVFQQKLPEPGQRNFNKDLQIKWDRIIAVRGEVYKKIEELRIAKTVNQTTECDADISLKESDYKILSSVAADLADIFMVSSVIINTGSGLSVNVKKTGNKKCERCWKYLDSVGRHEEHPTLCARCTDAVKTGGKSDG